MIGNPAHILGERYRPYAGRHEALVVGLHRVYHTGEEMQQREHNPELVEYAQEMAQLARLTLMQARDDDRLDHEPQYVPPDAYQRGRPVPRVRGGAPGRAAPRARRGRRRGGQQGGAEVHVDPPADAQHDEFGVDGFGADQQGYIPHADEPSSSIPSYSLQLSFPASQVTPTGALSTMGSFDGDVEQYFA